MNTHLTEFKRFSALIKIIRCFRFPLSFVHSYFVLLPIFSFFHIFESLSLSIGAPHQCLVFHSSIFTSFSLGENCSHAPGPPFSLLVSHSEMTFLEAMSDFTASRNLHNMNYS